MTQATRRLLLLIFTLSGASGLVYQVLWARQLGLVLGNTTSSVTIVLAAFMTGLALGAELGGSRLVARSDPLRVYAVLELAIGLYAVLFGPLVHGAESLYPWLFSDETSPLLLTLARAFGAFALLAIPTTLMGATLPLLTEFLHRVPGRHEDWNAGRLYGANTAGAALGAFASGFVLIELVGIQTTTVIAALCNALAAAVAFRLAPRSAPAPASTRASLDWADTLRSRRSLLLLFAAVGGLALAGEVIWTRALTVFLGSSTYAFGSILIAYLVGIALGSWCLAGFVRRLAHAGWLIPAALAGMATWHCLAVAAIPGLLDLASASVSPSGVAFSTRALLDLLVVHTALVGLMFVPAFLSGALFPVVTRLVGGDEGDQGRPIAAAYTWNTAGAIVGALVGGFLVAPHFLHFHAVHVLALGCAAAALLSLGVIGAGRPAAALAAILVAAALSSAWAARELTRPDLFVRLLLAQQPDARIPFHEPGLQGVTSVVHSADGNPLSSQLLVNGAGMTLKAFVTKAMAHLPIIAHGAAADTLVVCFGMGTSYRSALAHGGRVDVVELVPAVFEAFDEFYADADRVRANPKGRMIVNDGRNFLLLTKRRYDVITIDPPPPIDSAGVSSLYSLEFLELVRDRLEQGGIVAHWIPSIHPVNGLSDDATRDSLVATFLHVFPHVEVIRGSSPRGFHGAHLLGSNAPIRLEPAQLARALESEAVVQDVREFAGDTLDPRSFFRRLPARREDYAATPLLTDDRPLLEFHLLRSIRSGKLPAVFRLRVLR